MENNFTDTHYTSKHHVDLNVHVFLGSLLFNITLGNLACSDYYVWLVSQRWHS